MAKQPEKEKIKSKPIFEFDKGKDEKIVVSTYKFAGKQYVDVRTFFLVKGKGVYRPTKRGISIEADLVNELESGLKKAA